MPNVTIQGNSATHTDYWTGSALSEEQFLAAPNHLRHKYPSKDPIKEEDMEPQVPMEGFTFGCDPELFIFNPDGEPVSAEGIIPGCKHNPYKVDKGAVQLDGTAAEFNIDPAATFAEFDDNITTVLKQLKGFLPKGFTLKAVPSVTFSEAEWDKISDEAKELGCMPDFNAWQGDLNPPPDPMANPRTRCAGGHLHVGWTNDADLTDISHIMNGRDLVKQLDYYLGVWSLQRDNDPTRRSLYGKAGACRFKPYGVEYRVLSNFWIMTKTQRLAVWNRMNQAIKDMRKSFFPDARMKGLTKYNFNEAVIRSINHSVRDPNLEKVFRFPISTIDTNYRR